MTESALARFRLDGRIAFLSGAAGHLGRSMALALSEAGAHLVLNGRNAAKLDRLAREIEAHGGRAETAAFDIGDLNCVRSFFATRGRLDIVVNNAISMTPRPIAELADADFAETYRTAVVAPFEIARAARQALRHAAAETGDASIINVSSMYGLVAPDARLYSQPGQQSPLHYGPAKAAALQLTRHLAAELGPEHIRVNALAPGPFPRESVSASDPTFAARLAARTMLGRTGRAEEIAAPLLFLASPAASFMTGATLVVDGGWTVW